MNRSLILAVVGGLVVAALAYFAFHVGWVACLALLLIQQLELHRDGDFGAVRADLPRGAAEFVNRECHGQLFDSYNLSSYLAWETALHHPLFMHSLNSSGALADSYQDIVTQSEVGQALLRHGPIGCVILAPPQAGANDIFVPLAVELAFERENWALVYGSRCALVWARRTPANRALIAARESHISIPPGAFIPRFSADDPRSRVPLEKYLPANFSARLVGGHLP